MKITCGTRTYFEHVDNFPKLKLKDTTLPEGWVSVPVIRNKEDTAWHVVSRFQGTAIYLCPEHQQQALDGDLKNKKNLQ